MQNALTHEQLQRRVPSAFALEPWQKQSERYRFIPTIDVLNSLMEHGFMPVNAFQGKTRIEGKQFFTKHVIRLRHDDLMRHSNGEEFPEIVLLNSHDGTSAYKLMLGFFRIVCSNGLIVSSGMMNEINVRHSGAKDLKDHVIDASFKIVAEAPQVAGQVEGWKQIELSQGQQNAFAEGAKELHTTSLDIHTPDLLHTRRYADGGQNQTRNLWQTLNVVQENMLRGGSRAKNAQGLRRHTRPIKGVTDNTNINRGLWRMAEEMAKLAA